MLLIWFLSQSFTDDTGMLRPVAQDYGQHWFWPVCPATEDEWKLVRVALDNHQLDAAKQDSRVVYCGIREGFDPPPPQLLQIYADQLDPSTSYMFFGQVLAKLAQSNANYYQEQ